MAYGMTPREFVEQALAKVPGAGIVELDISGKNGGDWVVDLENGRLAPAGTRPQCIVRAADRDFMALVEGRMSVADGLITERLHIAGDAARLKVLLEALGQANEQRA